jgi:hypothetical protein
VNILCGGVRESHLNCCGAEQLCPASKKGKKEGRKKDRNLKIQTGRKKENVRKKD